MLSKNRSFFFVLLFSVCISCRTVGKKSNSLASDEEPVPQDFMQVLFTEINDIARSEKPISEDFIRRASLAVQSAHVYFESMYKKEERMSIWTQLKQNNAPAKTLDAFKQLIDEQDAAKAIGIKPDSPWAGGGVQNWKRVFPKDALNPKHWNDYRKEKALDANEMRQTPDFNYFFFGKIGGLDTGL